MPGADSILLSPRGGATGARHALILRLDIVRFSSLIEPVIYIYLRNVKRLQFKVKAVAWTVMSPRHIVYRVVYMYYNLFFRSWIGPGMHSIVIYMFCKVIYMTSGLSWKYGIIRALRAARIRSTACNAASRSTRK